MTWGRNFLSNDVVKAYAREVMQTCFLNAAGVSGKVCISGQAGGEYPLGWSLESVNFCMSFFKSQGKNLESLTAVKETWSSHQPNKGACQHHCCSHLELWVNGLSHSQELNHRFLLRKVTSAAINSLGRKQNCVAFEALIQLRISK